MTPVPVARYGAEWTRTASNTHSDWATAFCTCLFVACYGRPCIMGTCRQNQELPIGGLRMLDFCPARLGRPLTVAGDDIVASGITCRPIISRNTFQIPPQYQGALYAPTDLDLILRLPVCDWPPCTAELCHPAFGSAPCAADSASSSIRRLFLSIFCIRQYRSASFCHYRVDICRLTCRATRHVIEG